MTSLAYGSRQAYRYRMLSPDREHAVRAAADAGVSAADLAKQYGVHVRTIYRTLRRSENPHRLVRLGDYVATFELSDEGPVQCGPWRPA